VARLDSRKRPSLPGDVAGTPRKVRFAPEAKTNNGPARLNALFEEFVTKDMFPKNGERPYDEKVVVRLAQSGDLWILAMMQFMLLDLIARSEESKTGRTLVLPRGGGSASMVTSEHIPHMRNYVQYIEKVIKAVVSKQTGCSGGGGQ
jgi:hypothetical protein